MIESRNLIRLFASRGVGRREGGGKRGGGVGNSLKNLPSNDFPDYILVKKVNSIALLNSVRVDEVG